MIFPLAERIKVSVILTSYNHAKYLRESIDSVLSQTYPDFELIIVDDASIDDSWQIINSYSDPRIRAFRSKTRTMAGGDIRKAISEIAIGKYIAIHHSDDVWEPYKLEKQVAFLEMHPEIGAVFSHALIITESSEPFEDRSHVYYGIFDQPNRSRHEWLNHFFKQGNALCHPSVLIRKVCYEDCGVYRYGLALLGDLDMWVRLCLKYEIHILPEKLVRFRVRANGMNSSTGGPEMIARRPFEYLQVLNHYKKISTPDELVRVFPEAEQYMKPEGFDLQFALGMLALGARHDKFSKLFGLILLFEVINDPDRAKDIRKLYDFGHAEFVALNAQHDVFSGELIAGLASLPHSQTPPRLDKQQTPYLDTKEEALRETTNSKVRKFAAALQNVCSFLLPPESFRRRFARFLSRGLKR